MCNGCKGTGKTTIQCGRNTPVEVQCVPCHGSGKSVDEVVCKTCFDTGRVVRRMGKTLSVEVDCPICKGTKDDGV